MHFIDIFIATYDLRYSANTKYYRKANFNRDLTSSP